MTVAVIGSRGITDADLLHMLPTTTTAIVSGGAKGVDTLAAAYARAHGLELIEYLPDYAKYGKGAPLRRNHLIVAAADLVVAVWDGSSRGTAYTIRVAHDSQKPVWIYAPGSMVARVILPDQPLTL